MKKLSFTLLAIFGCLCYAFTQGTISGIVIDAETKSPLEGASVFAQNTTIGAVTKSDGSFKLPLQRGGYELIVSFTGYVIQTFKIEGTENRTLEIELQKEDKSMSEVVVVASNEVPDGWEKYGTFFTDHFIGNTPFAKETVLENPEALKFYYSKRNEKLRVLATEPLRISNHALGYNLHYNLDSFVFFERTKINSYRGNCLYIEMEGTYDQHQQWKQNREKAYIGSRLHFLRSYYDSTLKEEGFTVDILSNNDSRKFNRLMNPYDSTYYHSQEEEVELWFPKKASITYNKNKPEDEYLVQMKLPADVKVQISYVDLIDAIVLKQNGYFFDQKSWINQGYWSWKNLADQLPYDYVP
ncbi:MAG: carboxypeptidase-like regulatory domain-containing protein [Bacteroidota bacterium]|nr:carboxypeptidase-like regulatory domain-containing protein [Bacteroidota bacterium]